MSLEPVIAIRVIVPERVEQILDLRVGALPLPPDAIQVLGPYYVALTSGSIFAESVLETDAASSGENILNLPEVPASVKQLFINGLRQRPGAAIIAGQLITLPASLEIVAGDTLTLIYTHT
jgi:hypothetical protein